MTVYPGSVAPVVDLVCSRSVAMVGVLFGCGTALIDADCFGTVRGSA
jgi:hypothetical protein